MNLKVYYVSWNRVRVDKLKIKFELQRKTNLLLFMFFILKNILTH